MPGPALTSRGCDVPVRHSRVRLVDVEPGGPRVRWLVKRLELHLARRSRRDIGREHVPFRCSRPHRESGPVVMLQSLAKTGGRSYNRGRSAAGGALSRAPRCTCRRGTCSRAVRTGGALPPSCAGVVVQRNACIGSTSQRAKVDCLAQESATLDEAQARLKTVIEPLFLEVQKLELLVQRAQ